MTEIEVVSSDWDSTIADTLHRQSMIDRSAHNGPDFWLRYSMASKDDTPGPAFHLAKFMTDAGIPWIIVSGRSEGARDISMDWLHRHGLKPLEVFLCDDRHDYMSHGEWKAMRLQEIQEKYGYKILFHVDDYDDVAVETEKIGIPTILVHGVGQGAMALG